MTGMLPFAKQSVMTLSGGELQRTSLAQVFALDSNLLVLDEPTNHLDLTCQKQVFELIGTWLKRPGRAVMSVAHDISLARAYGSKALLLHGGRQAAFGETRAVLSKNNLRLVYGMDVQGWMRELLAQWAE